MMSDHPLLCLLSHQPLPQTVNNLFFHSCCSILLDEEGHIKLTGKGLHRALGSSKLGS